jgi:hypothetical protein
MMARHRSGSVELNVAASPQMTFPNFGWLMNRTYHAACVVAVRSEQTAYAGPGAGHGGTTKSVGRQAKTQRRSGKTERDA